MKILIDTREQKPLDFSCETERATLSTGDYSLGGFVDSFCIERKSISDLIGTIDFRNRDRFRRECERMRSCRFYALVIDGTKDDIKTHCEKLYKTQNWQYVAKKKKGYKGRAPMRPECRVPSVFGTLDALRVDYNLHYYFTGGRVASAVLIENFATYFLRESKNNPNRAIEERNK